MNIATALWLAIAVVGLVIESRKLTRALEVRAYLLRSGKNGARMMVAKTRIRTTRIRLGVCIAELAVGIVAIVLTLIESRPILLGLMVPLILFGSAASRHLMSWLEDRDDGRLELLEIQRRRRAADPPA